MSMKLSDITRAGSKGCIAGNAEIEKVVTRVLGIKCYEIDPEQTLDMESMSANLGDENGGTNYYVGYSDRYSLGQILSFLNTFLTIDDLSEDDKRYLIPEVKELLLQLVVLLRDASRDNPFVNFLFSVNLKQFFDHIAARSGRSPSAVSLYDDFKDEHFLAIPGVDVYSVTVGDFFDHVVRSLYSRWVITMSFRSYKKKLIVCYDAIYSFFMVYLKEGYGDLITRVKF